MAGCVTRLLTGEQHVDRREFHRLAGALEWCVAAEGLDLFLRLAAADLQGRPDGAWGHGVDADALLGQLLGQGAGKRDLRGLGLRVVEEILRGFDAENTSDLRERADLAKWGNLFLAALHQESLAAADGLAFRALNSQAGVRTLLEVCTTDRAQIQAAEKTLSPGVMACPVNWEKYNVAEMVFKTDTGSGLGHQERRHGSGGRTALVLCATRPEPVQTLERLFDLPA